MQTIIVQVSVDNSSKSSGLRQKVKPQHAELSDDIVRAFDEWKALQEKFPEKFGSFNKYLMEEKVKRSRLRNHLNKLSRDSINLVESIVVPPAQAPPKYEQDEEYELEWTYLKREKLWPYLGNDVYLDKFAPKTRKYYNSLATFPHSNRTRMHGLAGIWPNGTRVWEQIPMPPPINEHPKGKDESLKDGGFYLELSNALPLDRDPPDTREEICKAQTYDLDPLDDVTVIITFYNEHMSTLLRSIHSVLNLTPPPLLREIILVDDHSNTTHTSPGGFLYEYVKMLPKTKIMRLPERRGLVQARMAGAKLATAPVLVVLDSHIEVNKGWLEPQLQRLKESPQSVVFPQILSLDSETLNYRTDAGIGCFLSFKWIMQERAYFNTVVESPDPIPSPSMAGGLFAVRRDWFFESGAYDDEFAMWGAENVEMAFRIWMCGGRVECAPCSRTYHIYRHGGVGYQSPYEYVKKNRVRTARLWLDEYYQLAKHFLGVEGEEEVGNLDKMLELKERLQCKSFDWFLKEIDPTRYGTDIDDYGLLGEVKNIKHAKLCLDNLGLRTGDKPIGTYPCHGGNGSQGWFTLEKEHQLRSMANELCLNEKFRLVSCDSNPSGSTDGWYIDTAKGWLRHQSGSASTCMGVDDNKQLEMKECDENDNSIQWAYKLFERDPNFQLPRKSAS